MTMDFGVYTTNDLPGCPKGGLLLGTDEPDKLDGKEGDDEIRGFGGSDHYLDGGDGNDTIYGGDGDDDPDKQGGAGLDGGDGSDTIYGGDGDDGVYGGNGEDVLYGGDGNDLVADDYDEQRDKLYCGEGRDEYRAFKNDYVDSSCEKKLPPRSYSGNDVITSSASVTSSASASPIPVPSSGGPAVLLPAAAALLLGSGILTYAILRRR